MILRTLCHIAGVDRETLLTCPMTDRLWVGHLGFSLFLSFAVVFAITFHANGYVIADVWLRSIVALVVALTVFLFDRALYQSDWFSQGAFGGQAVNSDAATCLPGRMALFARRRSANDFFRARVGHRGVLGTRNFF
jgi:hypothetical protein